MKDDFFKFPSTAHLWWPNGMDVRKDKCLSEAERGDFLRHEVTVEEKVDGANLGISFDDEANVLAQNRGAYLQLPGSGQWKKLAEWLRPKTDILFEHLSDQFILFGEWCYARHSVFYDQLPDWFLGFDLYDRRSKRFLSRDRRDNAFRAMQICQVPEIKRGILTSQDLEKMLHLQSKLGEEPAEGIYLRYDHGDWLAERAKLVCPEFVQSVEQHWSRSAIVPNRLRQVAHTWGTSSS